MRLFSTEQISKYHPDKFADQISDATMAIPILGEALGKDGIRNLVGKFIRVIFTDLFC